MSIYTVEHMRGTAGINERAVETITVDAKSASEALQLAISGGKEMFIEAGGLAFDGAAAYHMDEHGPIRGGYADYWLALPAGETDAE